MRAEEQQPEVESICRVAVSGGDLISGLHLSCVTARQRHIVMAFLPNPLSDFSVSEELCNPASHGVSFQSMCTRQRGREGECLSTGYPGAPPWALRSDGNTLGHVLVFLFTWSTRKMS